MRLWPLFAGVLLFVAAGTLQNTVVSYRLASAGHGGDTVGLSVALYFGGLVLGALVTPKIVGRIGHFRLFPAMALVSAITMGLFPATSLISAWMVAQAITGFCIAGQYVAVESWLNRVAEPDYRSRLFGIYMFFWFLGAGLGPVLMAAGTTLPGGVFMLAALLMVGSGIAVLPLFRLSPKGAAVPPLRVAALYRASPAGLVATFVVGVSFAAGLGLTAAFGYDKGLDEAGVAAFVACFVAGGALTQYPIGHLADTWGRAQVLVLCAVMSALSALPMFMDLPLAAWCLAAAAFGGVSLPLYTLGVTMVQDQMAERDRVAAAGGLLLFNAKGSFLGPLLIGLMAGTFGSDTLFVVLCLCHLGLALYTLRDIRRAPTPALQPD